MSDLHGLVGLTPLQAAEDEIRQLRNQLAEAQRELAPRNGHTFDSLQKMWEDAHIELAGVISERDQLKQEVTRLTTACENEFASVQQLSDENQKLKQQLLASEASRERMNFILVLLLTVHRDCGYPSLTPIERSRFEMIDKLTSEPSSLALTEALKPVRENLMTAKAHCPKGVSGFHYLCEAISTLDKLCPKGEA